VHTDNIVKLNGELTFKKLVAQHAVYRNETYKMAIIQKCLLWSPYVIGQTVYILILFHIFSSCFFLLLLLFLFPRLISAVGDWMSSILPHMVWP